MSIAKMLAGKINLFIIDGHSKRFMANNKARWGGWKAGKPDSIILVYAHSNANHLISASYLIPILAKHYNGEIVAFTADERRVHFGCLSRSTRGIYKSFNTARFINIRLTPEREVHARKMSEDVRSTLMTKNDVFDISFQGISIGIDIYESYLRKYSKPTVHINDPELYSLIDYALRTAVFWNEYLDKHPVKAIVISHDCNIEEDILCRIAYQRKIPVYLADSMRLRMADKPHTFGAHFVDYRRIFKGFSKEQKEKAIALGKSQLERRFRGEIAVDMLYSSESAFKRIADEAPVLKKNDNIKVLIATHCFFDNPHSYGGMLFLDFHEWLTHLAELAAQTNYDWYIKTHPDYLPGTMEIIQEFLARFPYINLVPSSTSHHQLVEEGINFVFTAYGTVGHEYPAMGVPVINAGYNPRIAYDFNWHPKSIEEYDNLILNLPKLHMGIEKMDIYEFYYMHHYYAVVDNLIFPSHRQFVLDVGLPNLSSEAIYGYFLDELTELKHDEIIEKYTEFIKSGRTNYFEIRRNLDFNDNLLNIRT